ncbi:MAG: hypothetical protein ABW173_12525 [Sphingomonas sp.]
MTIPIIDSPAGFAPLTALAFGSAGAAATAVDATHPLPTRGATVASFTDRSGIIATAGAAQPLAPARAGRAGLCVQNLSGADLWLGIVAAATAGAPAIRIAAGQMYESPAHGVPGGAIGILGATAGQAFSAWEW